MPIYEYLCKDCGEKIEVLHMQEDQAAPQKCGFRCALPPHKSQDIRGFGDISRCYSTFSSQPASNFRDKPTLNDVKKSGFTVYRNEGKGVVKKLFGKGPDKVDTGKR